MNGGRRGGCDDCESSICYYKRGREVSRVLTDVTQTGYIWQRRTQETSDITIPLPLNVNQFSKKPFKECKKVAIHALFFGTIFQIQNDLDSYKSNSFQNSEDYMQKNITFPIVVMNNNQLIDINNFKNRSNQEDYMLIKQFIVSQEFNKNILRNFKIPLISKSCV